MSARCGCSQRGVKTVTCLDDYYCIINILQAELVSEVCALCGCGSAEAT